MSGSAKRGPGRRRLTEAQIVDAAMQLLDAGGPTAASIRRIAAAVDVAPTTVYTFFPDRAAVERAVVERLLGEVVGAAPEGSGRAWRDSIEALAQAFRGRLAEHPGAVPLMANGPMDGPNALRLQERLLALLGDAGLDAGSAARGAYVLIVYVLGSVAREAADGPQAWPLPPEAQRIEARRALFAAIPAQTFPLSAAAAGVMAAAIGAEQYLWGLRRVLAGLTGPSWGDEPGAGN